VDGTVAASVGGRLVPLSASATVGPLPVATVGGVTASAGLASQPLTAAYLDHLASHVAVVAGQIPPEGLGGGETAVTLPQASADQLGLNLSDRFCVELGGAQPRWCARIVGLWQPLDVHDPYWSGLPTRAQVAMGRYDLFELARQHPSLTVGAGVRFWANTGAIDPGDASATARDVRSLAAQLRAPDRQVTTRLDRSLDTFDGGRATIASAVRPFTGLLALLAGAVVVLVAARFLDGQARGLAVLRARGWPRGRVWRVAFAGMGAIGLWAVPLGLGLCALTAAVLALAGWGPSPLILGVQDVRGVAIAEAVTAALLLGVLLAMSGWAAWWEVDPTLESPFRRPAARWWRGTTVAALGLLGLLALFLPRLIGPDVRTALTPDGAALVPLAPALGTALLAAAAVRLRSLLVLPPPSRADVPRALAGWQRYRAPEQHIWPAFTLTLAAAAAGFASVSLAGAGSGSLPTSQPSLIHGLEGALVAGTGAGFALAAAGFGLHFRGIVSRRVREYGGLVAHGLNTAGLVRSVAAEQAMTAISSLALGGVLGVVVAVTVLPLPTPNTLTIQLTILGLAASATALAIALALVSAAARRLSAETDPLRRP
jgi:hypothetical protein